MLRLLLEAGVSLRTPKTKENHTGRLKCGERSTKGETPLEYACKKGNTESICEILEFMTQADLDEALCLATKSDQVDTVKTILERARPSPNAILGGKTVLYLASNSLQENTIRELLARGADASLLSIQGEERSRRVHYGGKIDKTPRWTPIHGLLGTSKRSKRYNLSQFQKILRLLIDAGADIEAKDVNGDNVLLTATASSAHHPEDIKIIRVLLDYGASVSTTDRDGNTVLLRSVQHEANPTLLQLLLEHGAEPADLHNGKSVLKTLVSLNRYHKDSAKEEEEFQRCISLLLEYDGVCDLDVLKSAFGNSYCSESVPRLLLSACKISAAEKGLLLHYLNPGDKDLNALIKLLVIELGADIETRNSCQETPFLSQIKSNWNMAMALVEHGARWDVVDAAGQNALWICPRIVADDGHWERLVEMGLDPRVPRSNGDNLLHKAARSYSGDSRGIADFEMLMDLGLDVNHQNQRGSPPLHIRQEAGSGVGSVRKRSLLSILLKSKQKLHINIQDNQGLTALHHFAAMYSDVEVARLLEVRADPDIRSKDGENALALACRNGHSSVVGLLIKHSKDTILARNVRGETPLHLGCASGRPESVYYLLEAGSNVHSKDARGNTPLHSCAYFSAKRIWQGMHDDNIQAEEVFRELVISPEINPESGADWENSLRIRNESDTMQVVGILKMLLAHGAEPAEIHADGHTPLDVAILWGRLDMAELLLSNRSSDELAPITKAKLEQLRGMNCRLMHPTLELLDKNVDDNKLFSNPSNYLKILSRDNLRLMVDKWQKEPEIEKGPYSLIRDLAEFGLTELMDVVGPACKSYDDADWVERHRDKERSHTDKCRPPLQMACLRQQQSNMLMIQLLVDRYGVDVNAHHLEYEDYWPVPGSTLLPGSKLMPGTKLVPGDTALHCLAVGRYWWQVDAIRYVAYNNPHLFHF